MVLHNGNTSALYQCCWETDGGLVGGAVGGMTAVADGFGTAGVGVLRAAATGADAAPGATVALPGAATCIGCPTVAMSSGWTIGGHSAATAGSMFQRRNLMLSTWKRR
jgi:hypothetical protein